MPHQQVLKWIRVFWNVFFVVLSNVCYNYKYAITPDTAEDENIINLFTVFIHARFHVHLCFPFPHMNSKFLCRCVNYVMHTFIYYDSNRYKNIRRIISATLLSNILIFLIKQDLFESSIVIKTEIKNNYKWLYIFTLWHPIQYNFSYLYIAWYLFNFPQNVLDSYFC